MIIDFKDSVMDTDTYQTYAFTLSVWALNILLMIISLTCLLIDDPIIYSDSENYKDYIQLKKQAEENLYKVVAKYNIYIYIYTYIVLLLFNQYFNNLQGNKKLAVLEFSKCLEMLGRPILTSRKKIWTSLIWQIIRQFLHQFKIIILLKKWNNSIFYNEYDTVLFFV
jgi:hypothetical protein